MGVSPVLQPIPDIRAVWHGQDSQGQLGQIGIGDECHRTGHVLIEYEDVMDQKIAIIQLVDRAKPTDLVRRSILECDDLVVGRLGKEYLWYSPLDHDLR